MPTDDQSTTHPVAADIASAIQDSPPDITANLTPEEMAVAQKIMPAIVERANKTAEAAHARAMEKEINALKAANEEMIQAEIERFRAQNKPLEPADVEKLLTQSYAEFVVKIRERNKPLEREFTIRELPQAVEKKMLALVQKNLVPHLKEVQSIEWTSTSTVAEKIQRVLDVAPNALDTLSQICQLALDPFDEESITLTWVQTNLSSFRIVAIVEAQMLASKVRDFFASASRFIPTT